MWSGLYNFEAYRTHTWAQWFSKLYNWNSEGYLSDVVCIMHNI